MDTFKGKNVLVFGLGLNQGGVGSALFFVKHGAKVRVTDLKKEEVLKPSIDQLKNFPIIYTLGGHKNEDIEWADLIIKNPAVKPGNPYIEYAQKLGKRVEQDMGVFLNFVKPSQIIGITGTKGKSTTSSMVYKILKTFAHKINQKSAGVNRNRPQGCTIILAGNIGRSVLDTIDHIRKDTLVILELSSFQLEAFDARKVSPHWAVITNIYEDHLNYYKTIEEYIKAKRLIAKYQREDDFLFINRDDQTLNNQKFLEGIKSKVIFYSQSDLPKGFSPTLKGEHNRTNIAAALSLGKTFGINEQTIIDTLSSFKGIPFRMELIREWNGIKIYNDTTATNPDASIQAIKTLRSHIESGNSDSGIILICGGMNKGMDYKELAQIIDANVKKVFFLVGDSTDEIKKHLSVFSRSPRDSRRRRREAGQSSDLFAGTYNDLEKLLKDIKKIIQPGDVILFSPAATSFNLFQNEFDRGRKFNTAVEKIFV